MVWHVGKDLWVNTTATDGMRDALVKGYNDRKHTYTISYRSKDGSWKVLKNVPESALSERC